MYTWDFYEEEPELHPITDANNLYTSLLAVKKGSGWKCEVQRIRWNWASELGKLQKELIAMEHDQPGAYEPMPYSTFELTERGKPRPVRALRARDRIVKHSLNDIFLVPHIRPHLIYDNGASLKDKGVDFARRRIKAHLERFYKEHGTNKGWVLLTDFSGYYDNVDHGHAYKMIQDWEPDPFARKLAKQALDQCAIDVSYMTPEEYEKAKVEKFKLLDYRRSEHANENRGEKKLHKSLSVGDPTSQIVAVAFTTPIDKLITIVHSQKYYEKYMDDSATICKDLKKAQELRKAFIQEAEKYKLFVHPHKTRICRIDKTFTFLQYRYRLADNGHVIIKIGRSTIPRMRRKLKKLKKLIDEGQRSPERASEVFRSWIGNYKTVMSKRQIANITNLYKSLYGGGLDQWLNSKHIA